MAGRARRPSAPQTKSWLRVTPARARRSAEFEPSGLPLPQLNRTTYVPFFGVSMRPNAEARLAQQFLEVVRKEVAGQLDPPVAQTRCDRRGAHRGAEFDAVEVGRRLPPRVRVLLQRDPVRRVPRDPERSGTEAAPAFPSPSTGLTIAAAELGEESREDGELLL